MSEFDALLNMIPIGEIAKKIGIDENIAELAVKAAVPVIVGGLAANAKTSEGEKALEGALKKHSGKKVSSVDDIDTEDGEKIVSHVFGSKKNEVTAAVADKSGNATQEIIAQELTSKQEGGANNKDNFKLNVRRPAEIKKFLDEYVIGQDDAKKIRL